MDSTHTDHSAVARKSMHPSASPDASHEGDSAQSSPNHYSSRQSIDMVALQAKLRTVSSDSIRRSHFPLHWSVENELDAVTISSIRSAHAIDPSALHQKDGANSTLLHLAASRARLDVLSELLALGGTQDLDETDSWDRSPLGALVCLMRAAREFIERAGVPFEGHDEVMCKSKLVMLKVMGSSLLEGSSDEEYLKKIKWGCTCNNCIDGWLSPAMLFRLQARAAGTYDELVMGLDMYNLIYPSPMGSPRPITDFALFCMVGYLPLSDRSAPVYATFIEGYALCFKIVGIILARKEVPTVQKMMEEMQTSCGGQIEFLEGRSILTFLEKGGCAEYVLNAVIHRSWEEGPGGDASFDELFEDDFEFLNLPEFANNDAHDVVRLHVGLGAEYNGPYDYYLPGLIGGARRQSGDEDNSLESEEDEEEDWDPYA
ncbi:uncharacterized protein STEHIDRAFT_161392 [Stereum hirsutum FP-91666 SS1]|uniref:uncharacterized protein n=1 Tax=Stereum hirsutum (strain FP-91666) TaxID=721885 RepID=UPI0004449758|nr:uncharacterized protein STEHIDRAFT_161392 [Stereum hirsutum FP-91666 SS1]EIM82040.1 hypothetical protein STEHIDRAFT_161392 [Stereum hirsutum FP-91666 SS1]